MQNILILCDDYYPSSRATIAITQRFAEKLIKIGYSVSVLTIRERIEPKPNYRDTHNGIRIIDYSDASELLDKDVIDRIHKMDKSNSRILKFLQREKKLKLRNTSALCQKWNSIIDKIRLCQRKNIYEKKLDQRYVFQRAEIVKSVIKKESIDTIVSVSLPFSIHRIANAVKYDTNVEWIAMNFDPYAFDEIYSKKILSKRKKEEGKVYSKADRIFFLSQFKKDYADSGFINKITYFDLPNIRPLKTQGDSSIAFDKNKINCVFLGNLFLKQRNPEYLFRLIESIDNNIQVYLVGSLIDIPKDYIDEWVEKLSDKLIYYGRVSQEEAIRIVAEADVLINIGNSTTNQCPSKLIDYISTGKPIINIAKIDECTSEECLERYPLKFLLYEKDEITKEIINDLSAFLEETKNKEAISFDEIKVLYRDFTMESMIDKFSSKSLLK